MKYTKLWMCACLVLFLAVISIGTVVTPDREFSENENRYLANLPDLTWENIKDGSFQEGLETYLNDHIWGRDSWITIKTAIQKAVGQTDIGGAYVGKDGYDFEKITEDDVNIKLVEKNIDQLKKFFQSCGKTIEEERISFMMVPTSGLILEDKLPDNAPLFDQEALFQKVYEAMDGCQVIDVRPALTEHKEEGVYYRTDHHWTGKGAFVAYEEWCKVTGTEFHPESFEAETVSANFRGSLYSKILDYDSAYDTITIYKKVGEQTDFSVSVDGKPTDGFYHYDNLKEKDQYLFFFGGNYGEVKIENRDSQTGRKLLLVKDSFANTITPLLAEHYDEVYMIDLRYFRQDVAAYMEEKGITDVMVLYNVSNFISDRNMHKLN